MQLQAMQALAPNFRFVLIFDNSSKSKHGIIKFTLVMFMYSTYPRLISLCTLCFCFLDERMYSQYIIMVNYYYYYGGGRYSVIEGISLNRGVGRGGE